MAELFSLGAWVRRRRALDLTRDALAQQIGCAAVTIKKLETDERRPSRLIAERLARCLQLSDDDHAAFLEAARAEPAVDRLPHTALVTPPPPRLQAPVPAKPAAARRLPRVPSPVTTLIGRVAELARIRRLLSSAAVRLVPLTGPPGVGKTRLALQAAHDLRTTFPEAESRLIAAELKDKQAMA